MRFANSKFDAYIHFRIIFNGFFEFRISSTLLLENDYEVGDPDLNSG